MLNNTITDMDETKTLYSNENIFNQVDSAKLLLGITDIDDFFFNLEFNSNERINEINDHKNRFIDTYNNSLNDGQKEPIDYIKGKLNNSNQNESNMIFINGSAG